MTLPRPTYHPGEIEVQRRAGVRQAAEEVGAIVGGSIPPAFVPILAGFRLVVAASIDGRGRLWASLLTGPPGFLRAVDETRLRLDARPAPGDPLGTNLAGRPELGLLAFDPATRRRARFNGRGVLDPGGGIAVDVEQVYGNCRKYIQLRHLEEVATPPADAPIRSPALNARQREWIAAADTFFIASSHPDGGADASHRGGAPGFVRVEGRRLSFADYAGNNMFNTLGNLSADPRSGLLFVDFASGDLLQLTGRARLLWDPASVTAHHGARHVAVEFDVDEVLETPAGSPLRWRLVEMSPFNP
jgi:predicted pyridoxine 5'-phosphate oxidase superfamily flavin-nucleotide-binding protein